MLVLKCLVSHEIADSGIHPRGCCSLQLANRPVDTPNVELREHSRPIALRKDAFGGILACDAEVELELGWRASDLIGQRSLDFMTTNLPPFVLSDSKDRPCPRQNHQHSALMSKGLAGFVGTARRIEPLRPKLRAAQ